MLMFISISINDFLKKKKKRSDQFTFALKTSIYARQANVQLPPKCVEKTV